MLKKSIIQLYGASVNGLTRFEADPIAFGDWSADTKAYRRETLRDLSEASSYVLDPEAADYADSFREQIAGWDPEDKRPEPSLPLLEYVSEIDLPHDLTWIEYDGAELAARRLERGHRAVGHSWPEKFGRDGYLIDDRAPEALKVSQFRSNADGKVIDPLVHLLFDKERGRPNLSGARIGLNPHMAAFFAGPGGGPDLVRHLVGVQGQQTSYDIGVAYMLFALLASPIGDLDRRTRRSLEPAEERTARKFGKDWITEGLRDHVLIRIGEAARRHLQEVKERKEYERAIASGRSTRTRHWVSEHERRYKSGKIIMVRAHQRGSEPDASVIRKVVG